jgi:DNA-binding NarL/FixJ family response regulator
VRRRRKRQEMASQEAIVPPPAEAPAPPPAAPALRVVVVGPGGTMRDALEDAVDAQPDMEVVGTFDDMDSGTSGIRATTRRSGVVVLVDVAVLEGAGTMTEIRRLRDRFPFCRFVAYGDAFDEDAASSLLFFGADGVATVSQGPAFIARSIRRSARPGQEVELETEATAEEVADPEPPAVSPDPPVPPQDHPVAPQEGPAAGPQPGPQPEAQPQPEPESERLEDSAPSAEPPASRRNEDGTTGLPENSKDPTPPTGSPQIWPGSPPAGESHRRMTPEDIWDRRASEVRFGAGREGDPGDGRPTRGTPDA